MSVFIWFPKKGNFNACSSYCTIALISHASKIILKILQVRLQEYVNWKLPDVQAAYGKSQEPEIKLSTFWIIEKARESQKNIYFCFTDFPKAVDCVDHNKLENSSRGGNTRPHDLPPEKYVCRSRSNTYNWTWNNGLAPCWERSTSRLYIVTLLI